MPNSGAFSVPTLTALGVAGAILACGQQIPPPAPVRSACESPPRGLVLQGGEGGAQIMSTFTREHP